MRDGKTGQGPTCWGTEGKKEKLGVKKREEGQAKGQGWDSVCDFLKETSQKANENDHLKNDTLHGQKAYVPRGSRKNLGRGKAKGAVRSDSVQTLKAHRGEKRMFRML